MEKLFGSETRSKTPVVEEKGLKTTAEPSPPPKIHIAARDGDLEKVRSLLKDDASLILLKDNNGYNK
jgi:hypothetical protein